MVPEKRFGIRATLRRPAVLIAGVAAIATVATAVPANASPSPLTRSPLAGLTANFGCATKTHAHQLTCLGKMRAQQASNGRIAPMTVTTPTGLGAADIQAAYKLKGLHANGRTVAIVDAMDDPNAEADLKVYRSHFGLPACTTANGCFKKINQNGGTSPLPAGDYGWAEEISLDLDMVSAACPDCHILLVEANSATIEDLGAAVNRAAATPGVVAISNSYGATEDSTVTGYDHFYNHPGIAVTVSSGDSGYGVGYPASSRYVTAVGGTSLTKASNSRGWTETAWSGAGSGCSTAEAKPSFQHDSGCAKRSVADVSAVADPNTGVAVYDTYNSCGTSSLCDFLISLGLVQGVDGYVQVGGTSASSPIIASVYALAGTGLSNATPYAHTSALFDVTSGSNGSCSGSYLCTAKAGYDGPTGLGTPNGTGAF